MFDHCPLDPISSNPISGPLLTELQKGNRLRSEGYTGRFAPSPTGPMHLGNLRTALVSWLRARLAGGKWLLRIDDLDSHRKISGAAENIQEDLRWLGLDWDGPAIFQSDREGLYESFLTDLKDKGQLYPCKCSRRELLLMSKSSQEASPYPGLCRNLNLSWISNQGRSPSWRLIVDNDLFPGCGDIILKRSDKCVAYHFATVIDEFTLGVSEVVRGSDLSDSLDKQLAITYYIGQEPLQYMHVPLYLDKNGQKLSKRNNVNGLDQLKLNGMSPYQVIAKLAFSLGLISSPDSISSKELLFELKRKGNYLDNFYN